jgi:hypothetical protein
MRGLKLSGKRQLTAVETPNMTRRRDRVVCAKSSKCVVPHSQGPSHLPTANMSTEKAHDHALSVSSAGAGEITTKRETGFLASLRAFEANLDRKLGIESDAIVRKLPEDKGPVPWHHQLNMFFLWASGTMNTSCFATGFLGWEFGLSKHLFCEQRVG